MGGVPKVFSRRTLGEFEAASASIPLRQLDRAFDGAAIRLGKDPGGSDGARRAQFRRYLASVDQHDPQQLDRLGDALWALIEEVAASKKDFLVKAAERDGFIFADGAFRPAGTALSSFAVTRAEDLGFIDDRGRRLHLLANDSPKDAIGGAEELVESVCRTVLRLIGEPAPGKTADLDDIANSTLKALELVPAGIDDAKKGAALVRRCLQQLGAVVASLGELRNVHGSGHGHDGKWKGLSPRHARLAVGAAVTFAGFIAETYVERAALKKRLTVP
jgi:GNAT superfamily N-acetyltransferase